MSLLRIVLAGRPNAGKSTLFNCLAERRKAIVHPMAGVTRDALTARAEFEGRACELVDTGGLIETVKDELAPLAWDAARGELRRADLVLFLVDVKEGANAADAMLAEELHALGVPVWMVANKCDSSKDEVLASDLYGFGFVHVFAVSAEHRRGLETLRSALSDYLASHPSEEEAERSEAEQALRVALVGRPNAGKSSLLNRILGQERMLVSEIPGTTRDSVDTFFVRHGKKYLFVDTAGMRRKAKVHRALEHFSIARARRSLAGADVVLLLLDPMRALAQQDRAIAGLAVESGAGLVFVASKWDLLEVSRSGKEAMLAELRKRFTALDHVPWVLTSAREGTGLKKLFAALDRVAAQRSRRVTTGELNRTIQELVAQNPPPARGNSAFKIRYVSQVSSSPPSFVLFTNRPGALPSAYCRYLEKGIRRSYGFAGTPIRISIKGRSQKRIG